MTIDRLMKYMRRMVDFQSCRDCELCDSCRNGEECVFQAVRDELAKVPDWIPVEERLPELKNKDQFDDRLDPGAYFETSEIVLVCYKTGEILTAYWVVEYSSDGAPRESYWDDWSLNGHDSDEVIAWMELPEPPEVDA